MDRLCEYYAVCGKPAYKGRKYCNMHVSRMKKGQDLYAPLQQRPKGSGTITVKGYVRIYRPLHPNSDAQGQIFEHVYVMSERLGRPLKPKENVHHKNGIKTDNRIENLELWSTHQPKGQRVEDLLSWAKEILKEYQMTEPDPIDSSSQFLDEGDEYISWTPPVQGTTPVSHEVTKVVYDLDQHDPALEVCAECGGNRCQYAPAVEPYTTHACPTCSYVHLPPNTDPLTGSAPDSQGE